MMFSWKQEKIDFPSHRLKDYVCMLRYSHYGNSEKIIISDISSGKIMLHTQLVSSMKVELQSLFFWIETNLVDIKYFSMFVA